MKQKSIENCSIYELHPSFSTISYNAQTQNQFPRRKLDTQKV